MHPNPNLSLGTEESDTHYQVVLENNDFYISFISVPRGEKSFLQDQKELDRNLTGIWKMTKVL